MPGQLPSRKTAPCRVLAPPHARRCASSGNRQGQTRSCWSRRSVRSHATAGIPKKLINPRTAVSSSATVAHKKTVRTLQWAGMKQEDALKTIKCSLRANARYVQRPPTVSNVRPERRFRCATFSQRWPVAGLHRSAHRSSEPSVNRFSQVPLCPCVMRLC